MQVISPRMHLPTHEEITGHAEKIWQDKGSPTGCDVEIWLEAERQLTAKASHLHTAPIPGNATLAEQKKKARNPQTPAKSAPKTVPAATGKPLWSKPHSK